MSKEVWRVFLELHIDRQTNTCDPPQDWHWARLLELGPGETVDIQVSFVGEEGAKN